jgi:penicillin amidase
MLKRKKISISGPQPKGLSIHRDAAGVPHIHAEDFSGALWGSGYAHAIDRSTQLSMMRILGAGRLTELLSDTDESLAIDRFFRRANWYNNIDEQISKFDGQTLSLCQSYCDGVNAGFAAKKVSVLKLLGYQPEPWTIRDTILISRMASYLTLAQSQAEVERFFIEMTQAGISTEKLAELFPIDVASFDRDLVESIQLHEKIVPNEVIWNKALPRMMASNNWVIAGKKTASGAAIMANDPHLEVNRLPNVWCEQSLKWGESYLIGMGMPGLPAVVIGRSSHVSWGATYTFMDTVDSWVEECQDGQFKRGGTWQEFTKRKELIKRKNHVDEEIIFYENHHGVLEGDPNIAGRYIATRWVAAESGAASIIASMGMAGAQNTKQAMHLLGEIESAWNWVVADDVGNIGYQMSGLMPKRYEKWNGFTPAPGWDERYDWQGMVDVSDLPSSYNPKEGYIVTANQDLNHLGKVAPINMPMGDYRAKRIEEVLDANDQHDVVTIGNLQMDVHSKQAKLFLDILLPLLEAKSNDVEVKASDAGVYHILKTWDLAYDHESQGAPLFEAFYDALRVEVFGRGEQVAGVDVLEHLIRETGVFIDFYQNFDDILLNERSCWYGAQGRDQSFVDAFKYVALSFKVDNAPRWKEVNAIPFVNMLFQGKLPAILGFDSKPIPLLGGRATPHQGQVYRSAGRHTSFAPSVRLVADMSQKSLYTALAGGPSDNRFSPWYTSGLSQWLAGEYKELKA